VASFAEARNADEQLLALSQDIQHFGGFHVDAGGKIHLLLTDSSDRTRAIETLVSALRSLDADSGTDREIDFSNVTVEVTPRIAEKVAVAQSIGTLSLSLRSIADNTAELERAVAAGEVKVPAGTNPVQERQMLLAIANRPMDSNTTYSTGGDVSRFQRRTVPARPEDKAAQLAAAMSSFGKGLGQSLTGQAGAQGYSGPGVRVARGNTITVVPVGAR
jgi:pilus assembly protein CpaB